MNFTVYDIALLVIFVVFTSVFLYRRRKNLKREGLLFLYKTEWGIKIINRIGNKYKKTLTVLGYVSIGLGFLLMLTMLYVFGKMVWLYVFNGDIIRLIKIPPIMPLIPYLPQLFKLNFLPPFYFTYWILIIAIVAIAHEFSHGIFAANKKVKIKSTGFGFFPFFLPVFLAAFVELDEKEMEKKKITSQMAVLSAGTFANILVAILFLGILFIFFYLSFAPSGVIFDTYTYSVVGIATISSVNNVGISNATYGNILALTKNTALSEVKTDNGVYWTTENFLEQQTGSSGYLFLYDDAPAIKTNLSSTIIKIHGVKIESREQLGKELLKYHPGDKIIVTTLLDGADRDYEIILGKNPLNSSLPYLGIGFYNQKSSGILGGIMDVFSLFKDPNIYYQQNFGAAEFIYDLLWWLILISFSVALVNMLPVGIFDGGRFFFLMMLALTKSKDKAKKIFSIVTYLFLFLLAVIMVFWAIGIFK
jgi:membrane-associated protease RseP (regulator of RpoE activity)